MPEHVLDVGGKGLVEVDLVAHLTRGDAELDRQSEQFDQFLAFMTDKMRVKDTVGGPVEMIAALALGYEMPACSEVDRPVLSARHASTLSNPLGNGISGCRHSVV